MQHFNFAFNQFQREKRDVVSCTNAFILGEPRQSRGGQRAFRPKTRVCFLQTHVRQNPLAQSRSDSPWQNGEHDQPDHQAHKRDRGGWVLKQRCQWCERV